MFEIFSSTETRDRFDKSDEFWKRFGVHCPQNQNLLDLYEVEHIDDPCYVTLAGNPKECFEYFKSDNVNKKHKGIKKGSMRMEYENYPKRIKPLFHFKSFKKPKADMKEVVYISAKKGEMTTHKITKTKFSQIKDKIFYFPNGILSLPFGHLFLNELDEYKKNKGQRIEKYFWTEKEKLLENKALQNCPRLDLLIKYFVPSTKNRKHRLYQIRQEYNFFGQRTTNYFRLYLECRMEREQNREYTYDGNFPRKHISGRKNWVW